MGQHAHLCDPQPGWHLPVPPIVPDDEPIVEPLELLPDPPLDEPLDDPLEEVLGAPPLEPPPLDEPVSTPLDDETPPELLPPEPELLPVNVMAPLLLALGPVTPLEPAVDPSGSSGGKFVPALEHARNVTRRDANANRIRPA